MIADSSQWKRRGGTTRPSLRRGGVRSARFTAPQAWDIGAEVSWISEDWILKPPHVVTSSGSRYSLPESEGLLPQNVGAAVEALELSEVILSRSLCWIRRRIGVPGRLSRHQYQNVDVLMDVAHNAESCGHWSSDFVPLL
ncbi:MAG: hypothetical protein CM15mP84_09040 [Cellvibrionales bacterium]|nr:MAG: hypothetical protein CM15mP84_09040 [Cellvibrionales bacterium]